MVNYLVSVMVKRIYDSANSMIDVLRNKMIVTKNRMNGWLTSTVNGWLKWGTIWRAESYLGS